MQHTADAHPRPRPDVDDDDAPEVTGGDLIRKAAEGRKLDEQETVDALDWFLSAEEADLTKTLRLNVGGAVDEDGNAITPADPPRWIEWTIRPLDLDTIKRIRSQSQAGNRRQRRSRGTPGEVDDTQFNRRA